MLFFRSFWVWGYHDITTPELHSVLGKFNRVLHFSHWGTCRPIAAQDFISHPRFGIQLPALHVKSRRALWCLIIVIRVLNVCQISRIIFLCPLMENTSAYMMLAVLGTIFVTHVKHAGGESYGVLELLKMDHRVIDVRSIKQCVFLVRSFPTLTLSN